MNAKQLAQMAQADGAKARAYFSAEGIRHVELSVVASWLALQDEEHLLAAAKTARAAIDLIRGVEKPVEDPQERSARVRRERGLPPAIVG